MNNNSSTKRTTSITELKETHVITGGTVYLSVEDARAIYNLTSSKDNQNMKDSLFKAAYMLRSIAKSILFSIGDATDTSELFNSFQSNTITERQSVMQEH